MNDWNVVITVHGPHFSEAAGLLRAYGTVFKTGYFNVLAMKVADSRSLMEKLREHAASDPRLPAVLARVVPATHVFNFSTPQEFEEQAGTIVLQWVPELTDRTFHVRLHRRGFKGRLSSVEEETFLDTILLEALSRTGTPGTMNFAAPDVIISVETIGQRAGLSLWTREDLARYPFLRLD